MAAPKLDRERAIRILIDAAALGDRKACETHKISDRTLRNYRQRLENDPKLTEAFRKKNAAEDLSSRALRRITLAEVMHGIRAKVADPKTTMRDLVAAVEVLGDQDTAETILVGPGEDQPDSGAPEAGGRAPKEGARPGAASLH